jgi:hypothetical protein
MRIPKERLIFSAVFKMRAQRQSAPPRTFQTTNYDQVPREWSHDLKTELPIKEKYYPNALKYIDTK